MYFVDQVDENDKVVGRVSKDESHKKGLLHRIAIVYIFNKKGELLVQQRTKDGLMSESAGGHLFAGESYEKAAYREMVEELGIAGQKITWVGKCLESLTPGQREERLAWIQKNFPKLGFKEPINVRHLHGLFELTYQGKFKTEPDEVKSIKFYPLPKILSLMRKDPLRFTPGFLANMNCYIKAKGLKFKPVPLK